MLPDCEMIHPCRIFQKTKQKLLILVRYLDTIEKNHKQFLRDKHFKLILVKFIEIGEIKNYLTVKQLVLKKDVLSSGNTILSQKERSL